MPRVEYVKSARDSKYTRICETCGEAIVAGQGFAYFSNRYGPTRRRHHPECPNGTPFKMWRPSQMASSDKKARLYEAQEIVEDALSDWDGEDGSVGDIQGAIMEAATMAREVGDEYREAAEAMGDAGSENEERADECEAWADELESCSDNLEDFTPEEEVDDTVEEQKEAWLDETTNAVEDVVGSLTL